MQNRRAVANAQKIISKYLLTKPGQYPLKMIINAEGLAYREEVLTGCEGSIIFNARAGVVTVNNTINEPAQKIFTAAHELGHFENEKDLTLDPSPYQGEGGNKERTGEGEGRYKVSRVYNCTADDLFSFKVNKRREDDANDFASELLMHRPWFVDFTGERAINFELIKETAEYFNVSLTAAAIRYATIGKFPVALIMCSDGEVKWSVTSDLFPLKYVPRGYKVRKNSGAYDFFLNKEVKKEPCLLIPTTWFGEDYEARRDYYLYEQNIGMKRYNSVLTLLWESEWK